MKEALRQALDMLNEIADDVYCDQKLEGVIAVLRQALETEKKTSPSKREWVGLTLKQVLIHRHLIDWTSEWSYLEFAQEIEQALKEKNT